MSQTQTTVQTDIEEHEEGIYDEIDLADMEFDEATGVYSYPCPCGDIFQITEQELMDGCDIAKCPSCSLTIRVIYDIISESESVSAVSTQAGD